MKSRQQRPLHEAAWPDMFENLQTAYSELTRAQFQLEQRSTEIDEGRALFQRVIESMSEGLFLLDTSGRIVRVNHSAARLLQEDEAALAGRTLSDCCGVDGIPSTPWELLERAPDGTVQNVDVEIRAPRGAPVAVSVSCGLVRDHRGKITGVLAVFRDITERKRAEEALRFLADASRVLASSLDLPTVLRNLARVAVPRLADWCTIDVVGGTGRVEPFAAAHADPAKEPLVHDLRNRFPLPPDAPVGYPYVLRVGEPILVPEFTERHLAALGLGPEHTRVVGELGVASHMCVPVITRGRTIGAITLNRAAGRPGYTAADLRLAQDLADRAGVAVENARLYREAEDANRAKDEFLATLSHELRTPLNAILGWTRLLRLARGDSAKVDRAVEVIERNARAQQQLVQDLLDLSAIVAGKVTLQAEPVDLARVVETAVDSLRVPVEAKAVAIDLDLRAAGVRVAGDPDRLQQIVWNLISNAIKFTPAGGCVSISLVRDASQVRVVVADTGKGIRPEFLPHVFDRFRQEDASTTRAHGGLGLGLAIVKNLVDLHGGSVSAESAGDGQGSRFVVSLPALPQDGTACAGHDAAYEGGPADLRGVRVLAVDDDEDTLEILDAMLRHWGATVALASSAAEGFARFTSEPPDVLISEPCRPRPAG
jgi:PAS domain S-box-containing protein